MLEALPHHHGELGSVDLGFLGNSDEDTRLHDQRLEDGEDSGGAPSDAELGFGFAHLDDCFLMLTQRRLEVK